MQLLFLEDLIKFNKKKNFKDADFNCLEFYLFSKFKDFS